MAFDALDGASDEALLVAYGNGDAQAARALTLRLAPRLFAHAMRMTGNAADAEDITQEAMLRLWKLAPEWRQGEARVTTWLYRVVANLCIDKKRRAKEATVETLPEQADTGPSADTRLLQQARQSALNAALAHLPDRQRQAVILRHIDGLGNPQIADILDISVEAVESLTARGKRSLAKLLSERRDELGYEDD